MPEKIIITSGSLMFPGIRGHAVADAGSTLLDCIRTAKIPERFDDYLHVWLDDFPVPRAWWPKVRPKPGRVVSIGMVPASGANAKDTLQMAIPSLLQGGALLGAMALGAPGLVAGVIGLTGGAVGQWIASNLIHVPSPAANPQFTSLKSARNQVRKYEAIPRIYGRIRYAPPLAAMPVTSVEGQDQYIRLLLAPGFGPLKITGFRIGDYDITAARARNVRIERHTLWNDSRDITLFSRDVYEPAPVERQIDYAEDWTDTESRSPRPQTHPKVVTVFTQPNTTEIGLDFLFPEGLYQEANKETRNYYVELMIRYRLKGATGSDSWITYVPPENNPLTLGDLVPARFLAWLTDLNTELDSIISTLSGVSGTIEAVSGLLTVGRSQISKTDAYLATSISSGALTTDESAQAAATRTKLGTLVGLLDTVTSTVDTLVDGASDFNDALSRVIYVLAFVNDIHSLIQAVRNNEGPDVATLPAWQRTLVYLFGLERVFAAPTDGAFRVRTDGQSRAPLWKSVSWTVPEPGVYEVQIRRVTRNKYKDSTIKSRVQLFTHRSTTDDPAVSEWFRQNVATIAMKVKATDEWNNQVDQVSMLCESPLRWYDGVQWRGPALLDDAGYPVSRNPAWQYCDILRGSAAKTPATDADIDLVKIVEFADWCNTNSYTCDIVFDRRTSAEEAMQAVCRCGKATPGKTGEGKYTVVIDKPQTVPRALITPRNSSGFVGSKNMTERPHALRVRFQNADKDFQDDEMYVYADGYGAEHGLLEPTVIEDVEMDGTTSPAMIKHLARYFLACSILRPEVFQRNMGFKHVVFERGDMVRLQDDIPMFGRGSARIKTLTVDGARTHVTFDEHPTAWDCGEDYSNALRIETGVNTQVAATAIYNPAVDADRAYVLEPYPTGWSDVATGDLATISATGLDSVECIVTGIQATDDLTARVTLIEHAAAVHDADDDIPEYDSKITLPYDPELARPPRPEILGITLDDRGTSAQTDGTYGARILISLRLPQGKTAAERAAAQAVTGVEVQYQVQGAAAWNVMPVFTRDLSSVFVEPVERGKSYNIRVRSVTRTGVPSAWFVQFGLLVVGKVARPPDVRGLRYDRGVLSWQHALSSDLAGFRVRHVYGEGEGCTWGNAGPVHVGLLRAAEFDAARFEGGKRVFFVKAVDTSGNESAKAARLEMDLGLIPVEHEIARHTPAGLTYYDITNLTFTPINPETVAGSKTGFYSGPGRPFYRPGEPFYQTEYPEAGMSFQYWFTTVPARARVFPNVVASGASWRLEWRNRQEYIWPEDLNEDIWPEDMDSDFWPTSMEWAPYEGKIENSIHGNVGMDGAYEFRIIVDPSDTQWSATTIEIVIDRPEVVESGTHFLVAATGDVYLPVTKPFASFATVTLSLSQEYDQNDLAHYVVLLSRNPGGGNGPKVVVYDASKGGAPVRQWGYINWTCIGY